MALRSRVSDAFIAVLVLIVLQYGTCWYSSRTITSALLVCLILKILLVLLLVLISTCLRYL